MPGRARIIPDAAEQLNAVQAKLVFTFALRRIA